MAARATNSSDFHLPCTWKYPSLATVIKKGSGIITKVSLIRFACPRKEGELSNRTDYHALRIVSRSFSLTIPIPITQEEYQRLLNLYMERAFSLRRRVLPEAHCLLLQYLSIKWLHPENRTVSALPIRDLITAFTAVSRAGASYRKLRA